MRAAVIVAHPCRDSFTHALAGRVQAGLITAGHDVTVVDLYAIGFRAAMSEPERHAYHGEQPLIDPMVAEQAALVTAVDVLVFVYPTWWSGLPAVLKGWLERVMVPGVGFVFDDRGKVRPGLTNIDHLIGVSTYGSSRTAVRFANDNGRRTLTRALRLSCGLRARTTWHGCYGLDSSTETDRQSFADSVELAMSRL